MHSNTLCRVMTLYRTNRSSLLNDSGVVVVGTRMTLTLTVVVVVVVVVGVMTAIAALVPGTTSNGRFHEINIAVSAATPFLTIPHHRHQRNRNARKYKKGWRSVVQVLPRGGGGIEASDDNIAQEVKEGIVERETSKNISPHILRIRQLDGRIQKIAIVPDQWHSQTLYDVILRSGMIGNKDQSYNVTFSNGSITTYSPNDSSNDINTTLTELGLRHGSLITLSQYKNTKSVSQKQDRISSQQRYKPTKLDRFQPYPELAKDHDLALRTTQIRRNSRSSTSNGMSYSMIAALQSSLHVVESQMTGTIQRMYMCQLAASRFHTRCCSSTTTTTTTSNTDATDTTTISAAAPRRRVGLLLGTVTTERKDLNQRMKPRTSLSSTADVDQYCHAARVHAIWEPSSSSSSLLPPEDQANGLQDVSALLEHLSSPSSTSASSHSETNVIRVARYLGLQPIGWIFSYSNDRTIDDGLPIQGMEVELGARLQIAYMKYCHYRQNNNTDPTSRFGTVAMDTRSGATEAFQLSDITVQMVAEDSFIQNNTMSPSTASTSDRYITTRHPVIVDGKETKQLDSVLCLVNVALLSHTGMFAGQASQSSSTINKRSGKISNKVRKAILKALRSSDDDSNSVFEIISDFSIILALDDMLLEKDSEQLCKIIYKWARGQKKSVTLDDAMKDKLIRVLDSTV
jgi:NPL4 family